MPNKTNIGWTDYTSNPIVPKEGRWGCSKVSPGCDHCYAEALNKRWGNKRDFQGRWEFMLNRKELYALTKLPPGSKVFLGDMTDIFHSDISWEDHLEIFNVLSRNQRLISQILTKRPGRMAYFAEAILSGWGMKWPSNVWAGTSVENQKYSSRLDCLARVPAEVRFVSAEPLLGPLDLRRWLGYAPGFSQIHWVIVGGESGAGFRTMDIAWVENLADQCQLANVPLFVKQGSARFPGQQGNLPNDLWQLKEMPK